MHRGSSLAGIVDPRADRIGRHVAGSDRAPTAGPTAADPPPPDRATGRSRPGRRSTGMRSWIGRTRSLASVVSRVQVSRGDGSGPCHRLPETGESEGPLVAQVEEIGLLAARRHVAIRRSRRPPPGSGGRRRAARKAGFSAAVSARALISRLPSAGSFAQLGTRPQRSQVHCRRGAASAGRHADRRHRLRGGHVEARLKRRHFQQAELPGHGRRRRTQSETSAHHMSWSLTSLS